MMLCVREHVLENSCCVCPLCMEPLEIDDIDFYPCKCEYQICRFCWHRLRTDENGLCPACRQPYPENPVNFKPLSASDVLKIKSEKKQKQQQQRIKMSESRKHLSSYRVLQKNLVYVVGLSARVADPDILKKPEYFGKYGRILKVAVGSSASSNGPQSASCTAYVTYARYEDALRAIQAVNNAQLDGRIVKASLGTTKYCSSFLRSQPCHKPECMYLHDVADNEVSFTKDDMHLGRHAEYEKKLIETTLLKDKAQRERVYLIANNRRKHSQSKSGERAASVHTTSASFAAEKSLEKTTNFNSRQTDRSGSRSRSDTIPCREKSEHSTREMERPVDSNSKHVKGTSPPDENSKPAVKCEKRDEQPESENTCKRTLPSQENRAPIGQQSQHLKGDGDSHNSAPLRSRLVQWTSPERILHEKIDASSDTMQKVLRNGVDGENKNSSCDIEHRDDGVSTQVNGSADPSSTCDWQRALGLSMTDGTLESSQGEVVASAPATVQQQQIRRPSRLSAHSDDELGFDPFSESAKGLADLLEEEKSRPPRFPQSSASMPSVTSSLMSLGMQCGWPSAGALNGGYECGAFGSRVDAVPHSNYFVSTTISPSEYFGSMSMTAAGQPPLQHNPNPSSFYISPQQPPPQRPSASSYTSQHQPTLAQKSPQLNGRSVVPPYPDPPPGLSSIYHQQRYSSFVPVSTPQALPHANHSPTSADAAQLNEWQEGLKALLPNVNVRFVSELNAAGYPTTRGQVSSAQQQHSSQPQTSMLGCYGQGGSSSPSQMPSSLGAPLSMLSMNSFAQPVPQWMPPPPGFSHISKR
ncbi:unnamed protein product [Toxocara canis]|uniref:CCR4-NOT transcription complex subunit 4 n=1 Tax=Toxocara canis TaxID=6265 RepID=A0A183UD97_TOXCA|nr:unnamed protein product [Toxocara canis]